MVRKVLLLCNFMVLGMVVLPAQMRVEGGFSIAPGGALSVGGDLYSEADLAGEGRVVLMGTAGSQNLNLKGHTVSNLEILNASGVLLRGDARIGRTLQFSRGTLRLGGHDLRFAPGAVPLGAGADQYLVTDGAGEITAEAIASGGSFTFPAGHSDAAGDFTPAEITNLAARRDLTLGVGSLAEPAGFGISRSWRLSSDRAGDIRLSLTHGAGQEAPGFDNDAGFITRSTGRGNAERSPGGTANGLTHSGNFAVPAGVPSHFSKSSFEPAATEQAIPSGILPGQGLELTVLPNPSGDEARVRITAGVSGKAQYLLTDAAGATVATGSLAIVRGTALWLLPVGALPAGIYVLRITGAQSLQGTVKIIKS